MNLGIVFLDQRPKQPHKALERFREAEPIFRKVHDVNRLAVIYNNMGVAYRTLQQWPLAERHYRASIAHWQQIHNIAELVNVMDGLGLVYLEQGQCEAIAVFEDALHQLSTIEGEPGHAHLFEKVSGHLQEAKERLER